MNNKQTCKHPNKQIIDSREFVDGMPYYYCPDCKADSGGIGKNPFSWPAERGENRRKHTVEARMCSCDFDSEPCELYRFKQRKARKLHCCLECGATIQSGETYLYGTGLFEGEWFEDHTCLLCERIRKDFCAPIGSLRDVLFEALGFDYVTGEEYNDSIT